MQWLLMQVRDDQADDPYIRSAVEARSANFRRLLTETSRVSVIADRKQRAFFFPYSFFFTNKFVKIIIHTLQIFFFLDLDLNLKRIFFF